MAARFDPDAVAAATFPVARRGYDADEVRSYLRALADELGRLRRECESLRSAAERPKEVTPLDVATVAAALGEEAARVLTTARDAAAEIRARSEEAAAALVDDANREALQIREQADLEAARRREQTQADAAAEIEAAKAHGREMVAEARAVRERMLADVQRRKEQARAQLEQMRLGHERVLGTFELAADALAAVTADLRSLAPDVRRTSAIDTGPVAPVPSSDGPFDREREPDEVAPPEPVVRISVPERPPAAPEAEVEVAVDDGASEEPDPEAPARVRSFALGEVAETATVDAAAVAPVPEPEPEEAPVAVVVDEVAVDEVAADDDAAEPEPSPARPSTDDLFARIRAARAAVTVDTVVSAPAPEEPVRAAVLVAPAPDEVAARMAARDEALAPIEAAVARRLKRALADEQNEVLDRLRRKNPVLTLDGLVGSLDDHAQAYQRVVREELRAAVVAGVRSLRPDVADADAFALAGGDVVERAALDARDGAVVPLRERLERLVGDGADAPAITDGVRTLYREWKTRKLDDAARQLVVAAYGRAAYTALVPGTRVCWIVDPSHPCPDGEDNALGGPTPAGEPFPTGHLSAPAYPGCRCALAPADG
jgi:DivIVA domain-containing protein